jgi:hypothetical protein
VEIKFDWKFWVMLLVTVTAAAIPIWLWQVDLSSKALQVNVTSITQLVKGVDSKLELKISQGSVELKRPVLSVIEVVNTGGRPIVASDFESQLTIGLGVEAVVRTATLGAAKPENLNPTVDFSGGSVRIKPLLLNAGDRFEISILSDGDMPVFAADARIAGVRDVPVQLSSVADPQRRAWIRGLVAIPVFGCYMLCFLSALTLRMPHHMRLSTFLLGLGCAVGSSNLLGAFLKAYGLDSGWREGLGVAGVGVLGGLLLFPFFFGIGRAVAACGWPVQIAIQRIRI